MKKKNGELDLVSDFFELGTTLVCKLMDLFIMGVEFLLKRYVFKRHSTESLKKIERKDLECKKVTYDDEALGYSVTQKKVIPVSDLDKRKHTMICGASGFGKSVLLDTLIYDDLSSGKPVIFIDPKGDNNSLRQFMNLCRAAKREFYIFSEYYDGPCSVSLNPAKDGSFSHIADRIHASFSWSEEHYETMCYRALKKATRTLIKDQRPSYRGILKALEELSDPKKGEEKFERKNIEGIIMRLENTLDSDFGPKLDADGLSMKEVWRSKKCIYIGLPVLGQPEVARGLGKLILGDLSYAVYEAYRTAELGTDDHFWPVGVYIDELSAVITDSFIELLNKCRGAKMELNFAFQSPSDINKLSPYLCEQILENAANWFIFKQRMESGASTFAEAIGTTQGTKETVRVLDGQAQEQGSQRKVEELLAHHNIIKNLNRGQAVLLQHTPSRVDLLNIKYFDPEDVRNHVGYLEDLGWIDPLPKKKIKKPSRDAKQLMGEI